jgi:eukaryotic-like serine/threonine-protein kinase
MPQVAPLRPDDPKRVGRYRVSGRLSGTAGSTLEFLGRAADGDRVMISLLAAERTPDAAARDRFTAEARAARRVAPFCAARILDAGLDGSHAFLVSEYIAGPLLTEFVTADGPRSGPELEALATGLATGLAAIHQAGLVHGSFGPEHVAMGPDGPRVVGFSITPPYGTATPSADMLAWVQTVLYAATGKYVPDQGDLAVLPEPLRGAVASCASADPSVRPAARQVVLWLLGEDDPPAGVLAEGSRRAAGAGVRTAAEPAEGTRPPAAAARPQRAKVIGWVAAAVLCVLAIVLAVHVLQSAGSGHDSTVKPASANQPAGTGSTSASSPKPSTATPQQPVTLPAAVAGNWAGSVSQGSGDITTNVSLTAGTPNGKITYSGSSFTCSGTLKLQSVSGPVLVLRQEIDAGPCLGGLVRLTQDGAVLKFNFHGASSTATTGVLNRA